MSASKISLTFLLIFLLFPPNAYAKVTNRQKERVKSLPFVTLVQQHSKLHLIKDYYTLAQHIDMGAIVEHTHIIATNFETIKGKYSKN